MLIRKFVCEGVSAAITDTSLSILNINTYSQCKACKQKAVICLLFRRDTRILGFTSEN